MTTTVADIAQRIQLLRAAQVEWQHELQEGSAKRSAYCATHFSPSRYTGADRTDVIRSG